MNVEPILHKLKNKQINIKQLCDWDNGQEVQKLMFSLKQVQLSLEGEISQSIQSHLIGKQKTMNMLKEVVPFLEKQKIRAKQPQPEMLNLIEMIEIKGKIDYSLTRLGTLLNSIEN